MSTLCYYPLYSTIGLSEKMHDPTGFTNLTYLNEKHHNATIYFYILALDFIPSTVQNV